MKEESRPALKHEFEHETPTVIHHPEEDLTILAKWLRHGMEQGPRFWFLIVGGVAVATVLGVFLNNLTGQRSATGQAWADLALAQTPGQKVEIADEFPDSDVSRVARLQAATNFFNDAVRGLPADRETVGPQLKKALDLFLQVAKESAKDPVQARAATFGAARSLEARNELPEAITQYQAVISGWPDSPEAKQSEKLVTQLRDPEVIAFYKELYTYKTPAIPSPSSGLGNLPPSLGGLPAGHPSLNGPTVPAGPLNEPPALPGLPGSTSKIAGPGPTDIAPPPMVPGPLKPIGEDAIPKKLEIPKPVSPTPAVPSTPAKAVAPAAKSELPSDPFTPAAKP